jgi:hypothetical protein
MVPPAMKRLWAAEYGGVQVYSADDVAAAMGKQSGKKKVNPNNEYSDADDALAAEALWRRLLAMHEQGALIGCSHRCLGVDHSTTNDRAESTAWAGDDYAEEDYGGGGEGGDEGEGGDDDGGGAVSEEQEAADALAAKRRKCTTVTCVPPKPGAAGGSGKEVPIKPYGILQRHAYSLVDMTEVDGYRLVRIRNPWGHGEWTGPWGDAVRRIC